MWLLKTLTVFNGSFIWLKFLSQKSMNHKAAIETSPEKPEQMNQRTWEISVADNDNAISQKAWDKIFQSFFTAKSEGKEQDWNYL